jgi:hypothetical protein
VAGSNDYRMVDVPGAPDTQVTGDAWLGFFWTRDGGSSEGLAPETPSS